MDAPLSAARFTVEVDGRTVAVGAVLGIAVVPGSEHGTVVTLRRAASSDRTLIDWALKPTVRLVTVHLLDPRGKPALGYVLHGARPVAWRGPELDASSTDVAMEELVVAADRLDVR